MTDKEKRQAVEDLIDKYKHAKIIVLEQDEEKETMKLRILLKGLKNPPKDNE